MITLTWPTSRDNYFANNGRDESGNIISNTNYFRMKKFISDQDSGNIITTDYLKIENDTTDPYSRIFFIDLDEDYSYQEGMPRTRQIDPFISSDKPFTIDVTLTIPGVGDEETSYFNKSRVFFSIGQNVSGVGGNIITVGTNATYDDTLRNKPVIGMITKDGYIKAIPIVNALELKYNTKYTFRLIHNPSVVGDRKLTLFLKDCTDVDNEFVLQSTAYGLSSYHNHYAVTKPRMYLYTSGWTNEYGWNNTFDYSYAIMEDNESPIQVSNGVKYPNDYIITNLSTLEYDTPQISYPTQELTLYVDSLPQGNMYVSSDFTFNFYIDDT